MELNITYWGIKDPSGKLHEWPKVLYLAKSVDDIEEVKFDKWDPEHMRIFREELRLQLENGD